MLSYKEKSNSNLLALPDRDKASLVPSEERRFQQQRMQDVFLLLENLALNEEATIKLILDCLYDVGSINLVNKKVSQRSLNKLLKWIALMCKPIFKIYAWRWVKKNLPRKVTNWLYGKVSFSR